METKTLLSAPCGINNVSIPGSVTNIGNHAFWECSRLKSVEIPDGVKSIGERAFAACSALTNVTFGAGVTDIGEYAFSSCSCLSSILIPAGVTNIGEWAFGYCTGLTNVTVLANITNIGKNVFGTCDGIRSAVVSQSVLDIGVGVLFLDSQREALESVTIVDGATSIGYRAFANCLALKSVAIPSSVSSIGCCAFAGCTALESIEVGSGVESIGSYAFEDCSSLSSVLLPEGVRNVGSDVFKGCGSLKAIGAPLEDWDSDGIVNEDELSIGTSPFWNDSDKDGLCDGLEVELGLDPLLPDSDGDGMCDGLEYAYMDLGFDPALFDFIPMDEDWDSDGLTNEEEFKWGTDPFVADTDGDGEPDFVEILEGRDPKQSDVKPKPRKRMLKAGREDPSTGIDAEPVPVTFSFGQNDNNPRCSQNYRLEVAPIFGAGESFVWVSGYHQMLDRVAMLIPEWRYFVRLSLEGLTYVSAEEDAWGGGDAFVSGAGVEVETQLLQRGFWDEKGEGRPACLYVTVHRKEQGSLADKEKKGPNRDSNGSSTPDPINVLTGSVTDQATDVSLPDPVQPLGFTRYYTSGGGWRHSFDLRFEDLGRDYPCISMPDGQMIPFRPVQSQSQSLTNTRLSGSADPVRRVKTSSKPAEGVIEPPIPPTHTQWVTYRDVDWKLSKCDDEYEVDMGDGALVRFSMDGRMLSQVDSHGNTLDFAYSTDARV